MRSNLVPACLAALLTAATAFAEVHTMTLEQALSRALQQNPDVVIARLDEQRANLQVSVTNDPFSLKLGVGSGIAHTYGFPSSIDGNAPAIFQAQGRRAIFDQPTNLRVASARESAKSATIGIRQRQEEVAYRVTSAFLDAEHAARSAQAAQQEVRNLEQVQRLVEIRVADGREIRYEANRARANVKNATLAVKTYEHAQSVTETVLAQILGLPAGDRVRPALEERSAIAVPSSPQQAIDSAVAESLDIRRLEADMRAKQLERKSYDAERLPKINMVSQYSLLSRFNNFDTFYPRFQRHNFQIGASIEIPLFVGAAPKAYLAQADVDMEKLRREIDRTKSRIAGEIQNAYADLGLADATREARRESLDLARENVSLQLILAEEGRATAAQLEAARAEEQAAWIQYYDAQRSLDIARLNIRRTTGTVLAQVQ